ncbi:MAG: hypothetical protein CML20_23370 [Rheinheimera sp.]|uniref:helix-turn-helix domain-containing protein n=1 Tax=Arsukibacterium sp. UBA3155 TaxID=1946058 RepID=UPI000C914A60|nr:AraC family transcriptional regulator [Arsukibacterium sp. UBA3155]MAD77669.1 hypothetical protein [Rheinheimera sp.]|tara:strand:- start:35879 stop:36742 length:864 start_codon:yes stop_codon:yes gene_type:complete
MSALSPEGLSHLGFRLFAPHPALTGFVECLWTIGGPGTAPVSSAEKLYPDGGCSLTIDIHQYQTTAWFECNRHPQIQQFSTGSLQISARFTPGALFTLFGLSPTELPERRTDALALLNGPVKSSFQQLLQRLAANSRLLAVTDFEQWLIQQAANSAMPARLQQALKLLRTTEQTVSAVASALLISRRTLERQMTLQTGFNPAYYQQCQQIKRARHLLCRPEFKLADVALACGFYDQAHFTHVFRGFVTETPALYRLRKLSKDEEGCRKFTIPSEALQLPSRKLNNQE